MSKAKVKSTTSDALIKKALPKALKQKKQTGTVQVPHLTDRAAFGLTVTGDCMAPEVQDGDIAIASPSAKIVEGMIVVLFQPGREIGSIKRLIQLPRPPHPEDEVVFPIVLQQENPPRRYFANPTKVEKMHAVIGVVRAGTFIALKAGPGKVTSITNVEFPL